eukprot:s1427_g9.t1
METDPPRKSSMRQILMQGMGKFQLQNVMNSTWAYAKLTCADSELMVGIGPAGGCSGSHARKDRKAEGTGWHPSLQYGHVRATCCKAGMTPESPSVWQTPRRDLKSQKCVVGLSHHW